MGALLDKKDELADVAIVGFPMRVCAWYRYKRVGRNVPEHVGDDEESHVAAANVDLIEMGDTAVASGDSDILELNVHIVLGWETVSNYSAKSSTAVGRLFWRSRSRSWRIRIRIRITHLPKASPGRRHQM